MHTKIKRGKVDRRRLPLTRPGAGVSIRESETTSVLRATVSKSLRRKK